MREKLVLALANIELDLLPEQLDQFQTFASLLKEWNKKMNLTAIDEDEDIIYKHFIDSLFCLKNDLEWEQKNVIDIGTGAGFPGIPLKIFLKDAINLTLFDSLQKRVGFLELVIQELGLKDVFTLHGRAEDYGRNPQYREKYDLVLARAVARLPVLLEYCLPFVKVDGSFVAMKGPEGAVELEESSYALKKLGGCFHKINHFSLKDQEFRRTIIIINKTKKTPLAYPRKAGTPNKKPLIN